MQNNFITNKAINILANQIPYSDIRPFIERNPNRVI
jgi:hypothetical protein